MRYTITLPLIAVFLFPWLGEQGSKEPRLAGSEACLRAADQVAAQFRAAGLDVEEEEFEVWLSRPVKASLKLEGHKKLEMEVLNKEESFVIKNVFGVLEGKSGKKGDFVLFGNHRDSWVNGAIDAGTGLAIMLELATTMSEKAKNGWLPDYTIRFASWDGEEYGIIGSVEYGEKHETFLKEYLIAYLNADTPITGAKFGTSYTPELRSFGKELAGKIKHPDRGTTLAASRDGKTGALLRQSWIIEDGLFGRPWFRNLYIAPGRYTGYAASICPGLSEGGPSQRRRPHQT